MGDRVSISFRKGTEQSVTLFSHWGGMNFVKLAKDYVKNLAKNKKGKEVMPLDRLEPNTVMVDFISKYCKGEEVQNDLYLALDKTDGDNSDNGHHIIELKKEK